MAQQVPLARDRRVVPILLVGFALILAGMGWWVWSLADQLHDLEDRVRTDACEQYGAPLDLSGMAQLCVDVGYQANILVPEDADRSRITGWP